MTEDPLRRPAGVSTATVNLNLKEALGFDEHAPVKEATTPNNRALDKRRSNKPKERLT